MSEWTLTLTRSARRQIGEELPEAVASAAFEFISGPLRENPLPVGKLLRPPLDDRHSARRETYRVIYRVHERPRRIEVLGIFARADAYRPR